MNTTSNFWMYSINLLHSFLARSWLPHPWTISSKTHYSYKETHYTLRHSFSLVLLSPGSILQEDSKLETILTWQPIMSLMIHGCQLQAMSMKELNDTQSFIGFFSFQAVHHWWLMQEARWIDALKLTKNWTAMLFILYSDSLQSVVFVKVYMEFPR